MAGTELTDAVNPLEVGLYHAVSLSKGCYVGQETLAKVHNLNAVKQQLWGLRLSGEVAADALVTAGGNVRVKSCVSKLPMMVQAPFPARAAYVEVHQCRWTPHRNSYKCDSDSRWKFLWPGVPALQKQRRTSGCSTTLRRSGHGCLPVFGRKDPRLMRDMIMCRCN